MIDDRTPPSNAEAEEAVLGSMVLSNAAAATAVETLEPDDFYSSRNARAFAVLRGMFGRGEPIDVVSATDAMHRDGLLAETGPLFVRDLTADVATPASAGHYAKLVADTSTRRALIATAAEVMESGFAMGDDPDAAVAAAMARFADVRAGARSRMTPPEMTVEAENEMEREARDPRHVPTSIPTLDRRLDGGGLTPGRFYVVGARPSVGKSMLATTIVRRALDAGTEVLFASLEMTGREVLTRMVVDKFRLDSSDPSAIIGAFQHNDVQGWPLGFMETTTLPGLVSVIRQRAHAGLGLVVLDYLQLLPSSGRHENRATEVGEFSRTLKLAAMQSAVPILACAQLNRQSEQGGKPRAPRLSDLRESGSIENDADVVMLLHRDVERGDHEGQLILAKNRQGPTGMVPLVFDLEHYRVGERGGY